MNKAICVFSSSSDALQESYKDAAKCLGKLIAQKGYSLVYGGARVGLMGILAQSVKEHNGRVVGIVPEKIKDHGIVFEDADEIIVTKNLRDRKALMESKSDSFVFLPGGIGTLEELLEIITLKQLHYHQKPLLFLNTNNYFEKLFKLFDHMKTEKFLKDDFYKLYSVAENPEEVFDYLKKYTYLETKPKWF